MISPLVYKLFSKNYRPLNKPANGIHKLVACPYGARSIPDRPGIS